MRPYPSSFLFNCPICIVLLHTLQQTDKPMLDIVSYNHYNKSSVIHFRVWRSLVSRLVRVQEAVGSNPATRTKNPLFSWENSGFFLFFVIKFRSKKAASKIDHINTTVRFSVWLQEGRSFSQRSALLSAVTVYDLERVHVLQKQVSSWELMTPTAWR